MEEIWRDIKDYEGHYQVSNLGNVRSIKSNKIKILKPFKNTARAGYLEVYLRLPGSKKTFKVHRLVAQAFIPNPNNLSDINHIDEDKENNSVSNLEWCDHKYNMNYGTRNERTREILSMKVAQYSLSGNLIAIFDSQIIAAKQTNSRQGAISNCINGKAKTHNGYIWKLVNDKEYLENDHCCCKLYLKEDESNKS